MLYNKHDEYICINVSESGVDDYIDDFSSDSDHKSDDDIDLEKGHNKKILVRQGFDAYDPVQKSDFLLMFICLSYGIIGGISYYIYYLTNV